MLFDTDSGGFKYEIQKSLRFRANASAYLSKAVASTGNTQKWTYSLWVKRGLLGSGVMVLLEAGPSSGERSTFVFSDDAVVFESYVGSVKKSRHVTNRLFRDPSAFLHLVLTYDASNVVVADRVKIYVNGTQETSFVEATLPALNQDTYISNSVTGGTHTVGKSSYAASAYLDGYLSEINFIDGQAVDPSYFGQVSAETGAWIPKKYAGTYGTNGFYLPFNDGSNLTNLTADRSGNGNNWTANNISLTSGVTYDWMDDTPTNNYTTLNPNYINGIKALNCVDGSLQAQTPTSGYGEICATIPFPNYGKWYYECSVVNWSMSRVCFGIGIPNKDGSNIPNWGGNLGLVYYSLDGSINYNGTTLNSGTTFGIGDIIAFAYDVVAGTIAIYKNGALVYTVSGVAWAGQAAMFSDADNMQNTTAWFNFGQRPFTYTPPTGFKALCTKNLPTGTITTSGTFSGNASTDGPFVYLNGVPTAMTINGNAVTFGNHADKLANGFKVRSSSASYNSAGSNTYSITSTGTKFKYSNAQGNP